MKLLNVANGIAVLRAENLEELLDKRLEGVTRAPSELAIPLVKKLEELVEAEAYIIEVKVRKIDEEKVVEALNVILYEASKRLRRRVYVKPLK